MTTRRFPRGWKGCAPIIAAGLAAVAAPAPAHALQDRFEDQRLEMVRTQIEARGIADTATLRAMRTVPRHEFVPDDMRNIAYSDGPLPIEEGQAISQPYVVAFMTEALHVASGQKVLEVGTGSGYQAAVLAEMGARVFSVEIFEGLARSSAERLARLGYDSVTVRAGDGYLGWPEEAPFDRIIVTAAPDSIPPALVEQLRPGGRIVIPVSPEGEPQELMVGEKSGTGFTLTQSIALVRFVPLLRDAPR